MWTRCQTLRSDALRLPVSFHWGQHHSFIRLMAVPRVPVPGWSGIVHQASQEFGLSQMMLGLAKHGIPKRHHVGLAIPIFLALRIESFFSEAAGLTILDQLAPNSWPCFLKQNGRVVLVSDKPTCLHLPRFWQQRWISICTSPTQLSDNKHFWLVVEPMPPIRGSWKWHNPSRYPLVVEHGNRTSPINGHLNGRIYNWDIFITMFNYQTKTPGRMYPKPSAGSYHDPNSMVFFVLLAKIWRRNPRHTMLQEQLTLSKTLNYPMAMSKSGD